MKKPESQLPETVNVIVETPKGGRNKYAYDPDEEMFVLKNMLPTGCMFPFDLGYIEQAVDRFGIHPDVIIIGDLPTWMGCQIECRLLGMIRTRESKMSNLHPEFDHLIAVPVRSLEYKRLLTVNDLPKRLLKNIREFFSLYEQKFNDKFSSSFFMTGKNLREIPQFS